MLEQDKLLQDTTSRRLPRINLLTTSQPPHTNPVTTNHQLHTHMFTTLNQQPQLMYITLNQPHMFTINQLLTHMYIQDPQHTHMFTTQDQQLKYMLLHQHTHTVALVIIKIRSKEHLNL